jgi:hypothetical protein
VTCQAKCRCVYHAIAFDPSIVFTCAGACITVIQHPAAQDARENQNPLPRPDDFHLIAESPMLGDSVLWPGGLGRGASPEAKAFNLCSLAPKESMRVWNYANKFNKLRRLIISKESQFVVIE